MMRAKWCQISKFWIQNGKNLPCKNILFVGLCDALLMGLGKVKQQYPALHSGGVMGNGEWLWLLELVTW